MSRYLTTLPVHRRPAQTIQTGYLGESPARTWVCVDTDGRVEIGDWTDPWEALDILMKVHGLEDREIDCLLWPGADPPRGQRPGARVNRDGTFTHLLSVTGSGA